MKNSFLLVPLLVLFVAFQSCKNDYNLVDDESNGTSKLQVPSGFLWSNSRDVSIKVNIADNRFGSASHVIKIYDGDPFDGGNLLATGSATIEAGYNGSIYLPTTLKEVYVKKVSPDNSWVLQKAEVKDSFVATSFEDTDPITNGKLSSERLADITCNTGCTKTISSNENNVSVSSGNVICITGNNITVGFSNISGGTIQVCGKQVTLQNLNLSGDATLLISSSASVTAGLNVNSDKAVIQNDGVLTNTNSAIGGSFINNGTYNCSSDFNINSNTVAFKNNGTMNVGSNFNVGAPGNGTAYNYGSIVVKGNFQQNSNSTTFENHCSLIVGRDYNQSGPVKNYSYIQVASTATYNGGGTLNLYNGAMFRTKNIMVNQTIYGNGSTSLIKISDNITVNGNATFNGSIQVCIDKTVDSKYLTNGAEKGCTVYIPTNNCNTEGNGTAAVSDSDGDGVPNDLDEYPNDPSKAYNNYYPSSTGMSTVAYEDQWPAKGDFDLNDVVVSYRYNIITNASNKVAQVDGFYKLWSSGGIYGSGFGVQFPLDRSKVSNLSSGTLESNQSKAVVRVFENTRTEMIEWNTVPNSPHSATKEYSVSFKVSDGPNISTFGLSGYNPFIWNHFNRGSEVHVAGRTPTDLASTNLFGTKDDNSSVSSSRYYLTKTGLPFAIEIPTSPFNYPVENVDITKAYLHFGDWAQSGGNSYTDWFSNTSPGYRNNANIYGQ